jgi:uridine kinase
VRTLDIAALQAELAEREVGLVGIDGPGGAGKSTLATLLSEGWQGAAIVAVDDFHRPSYERCQATPGAHGEDFDLQRLAAQVLAPRSHGRAGRYRRYDWEQDRLAEQWHDVARDAIVIVEGVYAISAPLHGYFDYEIWVQAPPEKRLERGVARDGERMRDAWVDRWMPAERRYAELEQPAARADLLLDGSGLEDDGGEPAFEVIEWRGSS